MKRAVGIEHIHGQPQTRRCQCDRPVPLTDTEPSTFVGVQEHVQRCAKCGHRI